jgi:UDP-N-acetylglucosamine 3-dehydrogenase
MRIGVWSLAHLHAYSYIAALGARTDVEFVGLADEEPERGARVARERGVPFYPEADDLLAAVDAVVITSANADHRAMAVRAAERGVSVLLEKPIATTAADARAIIDAFRGGPTLAIAFPSPFSPAFRALQEAVRDGALGRILAVRATNRGTMPGGFFIQMERSGGGAVIDHTVHVADLLRRLTGAEYERVYAEVGHGLFHEAWDDSGLLTMDLTDGTFATLDCSWSRPPSFPTWGDVTLRVIGERGVASADLFSQHLTRYPADDAPARWEPWGSDLDALMIDDFVRAVREGRRPMSGGEDGLRALEVALAAYHSAAEGRPVRVAELA